MFCGKGLVTCIQISMLTSLKPYQTGPSASLVLASGEKDGIHSKSFQTSMVQASSLKLQASNVARGTQARRKLCLFNGCLPDVFSRQIEEALNGYRSKCDWCLVPDGETVMQSEPDQNPDRPDYMKA